MFVLINTFQQVLLISATNTYNITDCYSQDSEVIVNKNTLRITVKL